MIIHRVKKNKGFVMLFAVTISSILLSIALGVANIAFKELRFGTSARDTNDAFFAADTGIECALLYDKSNQSQNAFTGTATMNCAGTNIDVGGSDPLWNFVVAGLGSAGASCAKVTVQKNTIGIETFSTIVAKGYNIGDTLCEFSGSNRIERELKLNY